MTETDKQDLARLRVLVAEDDRDIAQVIVFVLKNMGIENIILAIDGDQAAEHFKDNMAPVDLVICDWMMPGKTGLVVLKHVRNKFPDLPFLMLTAKGSAENVKAAMESGVSAYVVKPFVPEDLQKKVKKLVSDHRRDQGYLQV